MLPEQPAAPTPGGNTNNYDFIINPEKPKKPGLFSDTGKNSFLTKILVLVGGAVLVMIVLAFIINLVLGSKTNIDTIITLTQTQQEIIRLSELEKDAFDQQTKNAAVNTSVTLKTHQHHWLAYLELQDKKMKKEDLALKRDSKTDSKLTLAKQTSTFDTTYNSVMRAQLTAYANALKTTYSGMSSKKQRAVLSTEYKNVALLLKQWPATSQ